MTPLERNCLRYTYRNMKILLDKEFSSALRHVYTDDPEGYSYPSKRSHGLETMIMVKKHVIEFLCDLMQTTPVLFVKEVECRGISFLIHVKLPMFREPSVSFEFWKEFLSIDVTPLHSWGSYMSGHLSLEDFTKEVVATLGKIT